MTWGGPVIRGVVSEQAMSIAEVLKTSRLSIVPLQENGIWVRLIRPSMGSKSSTERWLVRSGSLIQIT